jgi:group I intron endonuclease
MKTIFIYKLIDPITNEVRYVGKTNNLVRRFSAHLRRSKTNKYHSARWINSLLNKNLKPILEIIEECNETNWEEREIYWINYYRELFDLTNILDGGGHTATYGRLGKPWSEQHRINYIKTRSGMPVNHTDKGKKNRANGIRNYYNQNKRKVFQYNLDGEFIREWDSAVDAGLELKITHSNITRVCKCEGKQAGGFIWSFELKDQPKYEKKKQNTKYVLQIDVNDKIINEFESATEASLITNISRTAIINCLSGKSKSSGGFKWEYK